MTTMGLSQSAHQRHDTGRPQDWKDRALCRDADPQLFDAPCTRRQLEEVRADYCSQCPVARLCLEAGQRERQTGIWGGYQIEDGKIKTKFVGGK